MVNIGLLGDISLGKTSILRLFVRYLNKGDIENVEGGMKCTVMKTDFSGEATIPGGKKEDALDEKETKTIHPNRIVFRDDTTKKAHTIFAPGGDVGRAVVRMGVITISRISTQIVAVFSMDRPIKDQIEFFNDVRFFPKSIYVCINKFDVNLDNTKNIEQYCKNKNIPVVGKLPYDLKMTEAMVNEKSIVEYSNNSKLSNEIIKMWKNIWGRLNT